MRKYAWLHAMLSAAVVLFGAAVLWGSGLTAKAEENAVPMYRLYYPDTHEHFYTSNAYEKYVLTVQRGWDYEGIGWYAPSEGVPVYRLYNPFTTDHHYTMDVNEYNTLGAQGWNQEGIGWYSDASQTVPVYREFCPTLTTGTHNYTTDLNEHNTLVGSGVWNDEKIGWYAVRTGEPAVGYDWKSELFKDIAGQYYLAFFAGGGEDIVIHEDGTFTGTNQYNGGVEGIEICHFAGRVQVEKTGGSYRLSFTDIVYTDEPGIKTYIDGTPFVTVNTRPLMSDDASYRLFFPHTPLSAIPNNHGVNWWMLYTEQNKAAGELTEGVYLLQGEKTELPYVRGTWPDHFINEDGQIVRPQG